MVKNNKVLVVDLDGTLLNHRQEVSESNEKAIKKFLNMGGRFVLASGRPYRLIQSYIDILGLNKSDFVICRDGQYICNCLGNVIYSEELLTTEDCEYIIDLLEDKRIDLFTNQYDYLYAPTFVEYIKLKIFSLSNKRAIVIRKNSKNFFSKVEKVKIYTLDIANDILKKLESKFSVYRIRGTSYEVNPYGVNKYKAIQYVMNRMNIDVSNIIYIGDDDNDIECFKNIPCSIAMGNATDYIKDKAFFITKTNDDDGVAYALSVFLKGDLYG